jgi:hypothetical protein
MSLFVTGSLDQISTTDPIGTPGIAFLASRSGPGHAAPRASITLAAVRPSSSVMVAVIEMLSF